MSQFELNAGAGSDAGAGKKAANAAAGAETQGEVRLRRPERRQMELVPQCTDDLVSATHPVRTVAAVVAKLNLLKSSAVPLPTLCTKSVNGPKAPSPGTVPAAFRFHKPRVRQPQHRNQLPLLREAGNSPLPRSQFPRRCVHASACESPTGRFTLRTGGAGSKGPYVSPSSTSSISCLSSSRPCGATKPALCFGPRGVSVHAIRSISTNVLRILFT